MDVHSKLEKLSDAATYDVCSADINSIAEPEQFIYPAKLSGGVTPLLKVLLTNACENDCLYCANRCSISSPRYTFEPDELASTFMQLKNKGKVDGLFLSSGICGKTKETTEKMIKTVEIVRLKHKFTGYIHLKILPESSIDYVRRAIQLADRVSINLEAPNQERLSLISRDKDFDKLIERIKWISDISSEEHLPAGHTTQFVVGAADETDKEILETTFKLHREYNLRRAYFSPFRPVDKTPLQGHRKTPKERKIRLYQTDFLLRDYSFSMEEIPFSEEEFEKLLDDFIQRDNEEMPVSTFFAALESIDREKKKKLFQ